MQSLANGMKTKHLYFNVLTLFTLPHPQKNFGSTPEINGETILNDSRVVFFHL